MSNIINRGTSLYSTSGPFLDSKLPKGRKICLNMIIKESNPDMVINCIRDVAKNIDAVVISDTGSPEKTLVDLTKFLKTELKKPFKITRDLWKNFGHNRTVAVIHAEEYLFPDVITFKEWKDMDECFIMFMDADNITEGVPVWDRSKLNADV